jgi:hypothetical protein
MHRQLYGEICQPEANRAISEERTPPACCFRRRAETRPAARDQHNLLASRFVSPILQTRAPPLKQFRMAGYSDTPLAQKLGIKPAMTVTVINQPADYRQLLGEGADGVEFSDRISTDSSFVHLFTTRHSELTWSGLRLMVRRSERNCQP